MHFQTYGCQMNKLDTALVGIIGAKAAGHFYHRGACKNGPGQNSVEVVD